MTCWISTWLSFLVLILVLIKFFVLFLLDECSLHHTVKLTLMGLLGDILDLLVVEVFSIGVWRSLLVVSLCFLMFRLLWLLNFMELYMLWRKLKMGLTKVWLDYDFVLPWFVLHLLLGLILVLIIVGKSCLRLLIFFMKEMRVLVSWVF